MIYIEFIFVYGVRNWSRMGQGSPGHAVPGLPWGDGYSWCGPGQCGTLGQPDKLATLPGLCSHWHYQGRGGLQNIVFLGISNSGENSSSSLPTWHPFTMVNNLPVGINLTGTSVNPARSLAPAILLMGTAIKQVWVFIVGPFVGAFFAGLLYNGLNKRTRK